MTEGCSGAELENIINLAALQCVRNAKMRGESVICISNKELFDFISEF